MVFLYIPKYVAVVAIFWHWGGTTLATFTFTAQKMKFSIKDFFSKCDQIRRKLQIWSHLLNKFLMENSCLYSIKNVPCIYHFLEMQMMFFSWLFQFYTSTRNQRVLPSFSYNLARCNIDHRNVFKTYPNIYDGAFLLSYLAQFFTKSMHCNTFLL